MSRILSFAAFLVVATSAIKLELTETELLPAPIQVLPTPVQEAIEMQELPSLTSFDPEFDLQAEADELVSTMPVDDEECGC